jgi:ketosteroid isomerase-like protein
MSASFNRGDIEAMLACWHPDGEWRDPMHAPDTPERVQGVAAIRTLMQQWTEAFDDFIAEVDEYIDVGDRVVCVTRWRGKGKGSGLVIDVRTADVYLFTDGLVVQATVGYPDRESALQAAGLADA